MLKFEFECKFKFKAFINRKHVMNHFKLNVILQLYIFEVLNPILSYTMAGGGGVCKSRFRNFGFTHLILEPYIICALCVGDFFQKIVLHCDAKKNLIGDQDLAVKQFSKFKVDLIFILFCDFNIALVAVTS